MQKKITEAHILLIITFGLYMGFQWISLWLPAGGIALTTLRVIIGQLILVLPGACYMKLKYKGEVLEERFLLYPPTWHNVKMAVGVLIFAYPVVICINLLSMMFVESATSSLVSSLTSLGFFPMLITMAVMPAINEEFLCRGILYQAYRPVSKLGGAFLSAFIFGLLHLNFNQMPYAFFLGLVFALMVEATGSLYTSMLMHFLMNGFTVVLNFYASTGSLGTETESSLAAVANEDAAQQLAESVTAMSDDLSSVLPTVMAVLIVFLLLTGWLIARTFKINGRTLRRSMERTDADLTVSMDNASKNVKSKNEKAAIVDIWVLFFIGFALIVTYLNTDFL